MATTPTTDGQRVTEPVYRKPSSDFASTDLTTWNDISLLAAICQGSEKAFEVFYQRYHRYAYTLACRIVCDAHLAEDIVQDAFLAVWGKAATYQESLGSVKSWLQAIVQHKAIDWLRSAPHRDKQWTILLGESAEEPVFKHVDVWEEAWQKERRAILLHVLEQLPAEQRRAIAWNYFGGCTHSELAVRWRIPLGTVKGRVRLGLRRMKILLGEYDIVYA